MKAAHLQQGTQAEAACCDFLKQQGLSFIEKNFHCRLGEIDLIMLDNNTLTFIEVRYRKNNLFGGGEASVTLKKQKKIRLTAELYLQKNPKYQNARFDVVAMSPTTQSSTYHQTVNNYTFNWIKNAF